jgi:hypothetical protein
MKERDAVKRQKSPSHKAIRFEMTRVFQHSGLKFTSFVSLWQ